MENQDAILWGGDPREIVAPKMAAVLSVLFGLDYDFYPALASVANDQA